MRKVTVECDCCGFQKSFNEDEFESTILEGWAYIRIRGPYKDMEICPECCKRRIKNFLGITKSEEEK